MQLASADYATSDQEAVRLIAVKTKSGVYTPTPSAQMYVPLLEAFNHFNDELFGGALPDCLVTIRAKGRTQGFYHAKRFAALRDKAVTDEIAMNPAFFPARPLRDIASTFVHEMAHHWQEHRGRPPRNGYHDREWAAKMRSIGLMPSDTEAVGGRQTGYHMSHYIIEGGAFALSFERLEACGWQIGWGDAVTVTGAPTGEGGGAVESPKPKRERYVCSGCGAKMYGPSSVGDLIHVHCGGRMAMT
jgi:predicted SprT family Zn-dependent metalloprotease